MGRVTKWVPTTNKAELRRLGKAAEELSEATKVVSRCIIQGIDEIDPASGRTNREELEREIADVQCQLDRLVEFYKLNRRALVMRIQQKNADMEEWEKLSEGEDA